MNCNLILIFYIFIKNDKYKRKHNIYIDNCTMHLNIAAKITYKLE